MGVYIGQIAAATTGTLGFALFFKVKTRNLPAAILNGTLAWSVYLILFHFTEDIFLSNLAAAACVELYSEIMARKLKAPVNVFLMPGIIPLLPGKPLYLTIEAFITGEKIMGMQYGKETLQTTLGIVTGIVVMSTIVVYILDRKRNKN